jgi:transposase-like protein
VDRQGAITKERTATMPRRHYPNEFRQECVNLLLRNGCVAQAASPQAKGRSEAPVADAAVEVRRLQREVEYLRRQREILKKAMSILSEDPQSGMR